MPYDKYSFARLASRPAVASAITVSGTTFFYEGDGRRISGQIHMPTDASASARTTYPVIVMARGYVDKAIYQTGVGTRPAAAYYASRGFITLAPDFSGYGQSDSEDPDPFGARLTKPVEIIDLLASLPSLPQADLSHVYLWGHSNGGQIMLSVAEILGGMNLQGQTLKATIRGLTLWAPVSKPFPYNILYYTDQPPDSPAPGASSVPDDEGKLLRKELADFEVNYDVLNYSIDKYVDWITIPIQLHQGTADPLVPKAWSDTLVKTLKSDGKTVQYWTYPGADHNLSTGWNIVVARDVEWWQSLQ